MGLYGLLSLQSISSFNWSLDFLAGGFSVMFIFFLSPSSPPPSRPDMNWKQKSQQKNLPAMQAYSSLACIV